MIILWIRKKKTVKKPGKNSKQLFKTHDEDMKQFRSRHSDMNKISVEDILAEEGNSLVPVHKVKLTENIQN